MRGLTAGELLELCEQGWSREPLDRALLIAASACPEADPEELAGLSVGRRDSLLLQVRELTFGSRVECISACPSCRSTVDLDFVLPEIRTGDSGRGSVQPLEIDGLEITVRPPDTEDMRAAARIGDVDQARAVLLNRCVSARRNGLEVGTDQLPDEVVSAIAEEMARRDPQADVRLAVTCPACGRQWSAVFDIVPFLWKEVQRASQKILRDVHTLARAYGWRESEILGMSSWRRQAYLTLAVD